MSRSYRALADDATYEGLSNFTRVLDLVERNYVEEVDSEKLTNSAIDGMLKTLDPYSTYLSPERYRELEIGTSGEFGGVGMEVSEENGVLTVITPDRGEPRGKSRYKAQGPDNRDRGEIHTGHGGSGGGPASEGPERDRGKNHDQKGRGAEPRVVTLIRDKIVVKSVKSELLDNGIGYIRLAQFQDHSSQELKEGDCRARGAERERA